MPVKLYLPVKRLADLK